METALAAALVSGCVALVSAGVTFWNARRTVEQDLRIEKLKQEYDRTKEEHREQRELSRYREPLVRSAYDLQSRIYNILEAGFHGAFAEGAHPRVRNYAIENTVYVIAQFFCWSELVRRDVQFIPLDHHEQTLRLAHLQDRIQTIWGTSALPPLLRFFAGEQRAIGEALIRPSPQGPQCIGYGGFLKELDRGKDMLLDAARADVVRLASDAAGAVKRLVEVQHALVDLIMLLDPEHLRFPADRITKVSQGKRSVGAAITRE
jgi:hypothetical protein